MYITDDSPCHIITIKIQCGLNWNEWMNIKILSHKSSFIHFYILDFELCEEYILH